MTKHVCKISHLNSKQLLRKLQENVRGYFILTHPVDGYLLHYDLRSRCQNRSMSYSVLPVLRNARISHIILAGFFAAQSASFAGTCFIFVVRFSARISSILFRLT